MKHRRAKGEGSIVQRPDGTWQFSIDLGKDAAGKRQRRYIYAKTRSELLRKITDVRARGGGEIKPRAAGTVGEWVERWLHEDVRPNRSPTTTVLYEGVWKLHIAPHIGSLALDQLDADRVSTL